MGYKPGDILYRKYSDADDIYCVVKTYNSHITDAALVRLLPYYNTGRDASLETETANSVESWFIKVDLGNYQIKDKFIKKIKKYLDENLGKIIAYDEALTNLDYIEILASLRPYETQEEKDANK